MDCPFCGSWKPVKWDMCRACLCEYGGRDEWPDWVRAVVEDVRRERWQTTYRQGREICLPPFVLEEIDELEWPAPLRTGEGAEWELSGGVLLRVSPYDCPELDRQYQASHRLGGYA